LRVLVVDDDAWTQRMVSAILGQAGHHVEVASDGWEALIYVQRAPPDLVITEVRLPTTDGWTFVETLRARPEMSATPVIFLAEDPADRTPGPSFRVGSDHLLAKPFRMEHLETKVEAVLARSPERNEPTESHPMPQWSENAGDGEGAGVSRHVVLSGRLDEFALSSVLIVLELERKSGMLVLSGDQATGRIAVRDGRVVRADVDGPGAQRGALAVFDLLAWTRGRFEFEAGDVRGDDEIRASTSFLLMEGARLEDERDHRGGN